MADDDIPTAAELRDRSRNLITTLTSQRDALLAAAAAALEFIQRQRMGSGNVEPMLLAAIAKAEPA